MVCFTISMLTYILLLPFVAATKVILSDMSEIVPGSYPTASFISKQSTTQSINRNAKVSSILASLQASATKNSASAIKVTSSKPPIPTKKVTSSTRSVKKSSSKKTTSTKPVSVKKSSSKKTTTTKAVSLSKTTTVDRSKLRARQAVTTSTSSCLAAPSSVHTYIPKNSTAAGFMLDSTLFNTAGNNWLAPAGYYQVFVSQFAAISTTNYLGFYQLPDYNLTACAALCNSVSSCAAFNIYYQRDPTVIPAANCPDPPAQVSISCALWGTATTNSTMATNYGQYNQNFFVVITGSNAYNKNPIPAQSPGFTTPIALAGAYPLRDSTLVWSGFNQATGASNNNCNIKCQAITASARAAAIAANATTYKPCNFAHMVTTSYQGAYAGWYCLLYSSGLENRPLLTAEPLVINNTLVTTNVTSSWGNYLSPFDSGIVNSTWTYIPTDSAASCSGISSKSTWYTDVNSIQYRTSCSRDMLYMGDIGTSPAKDFYSCFALCDNFTGCTAFTFSSGTCWFKNLGQGSQYYQLTYSSNSDFAYKANTWNLSATVPFSSLISGWTSTTSATLTSFSAGTGYVITMIPAPATTSNLGQTTYITTAIDSGTANYVATSTIAPDANGTGTIQYVYPTAACGTTSKGYNLAFYPSYTASLLGAAQWNWEVFSTLAPTFTATPTGYIGLQALNAVDTVNMQGRGPSDTANVTAEMTFYVYAGRGTGNYTFYMPYADDAALLWVGSNATLGWTRSNYDMANYWGSRGINPVTGLSIYAQMGAWIPVRLGWMNRGGAGAISLGIYAPDGSPIAYSVVNSSDTSTMLTQSFLSNHILSAPCQNVQVAQFPAWGNSSIQT